MKGAARESLYDCQSCGACCCNTAKNIAQDYPFYVEVEKSDVLFKTRRKLLAEVAEPDDKGVYHLKLVGDEQRCIALKGELGEQVTCSIYQFRPSGCRQVTGGDDECLRARKLHPPKR